MNRLIGAGVFGAIVFFLALLQLAFGASFIVVAALMVASFLALPAIFNRQKSPSDIVLIGLAFYFGIGSLFFKTMFRQSVDANLVTPALTASALMLASLSVLAGYFASRYVFRNAGDALGLSAFFRTRGGMAAIVAQVTLFACGTYLLQIYFVKGGDTPGGGDAGGGAIGFFGMFYFLVNIAVGLLYGYAALTRKKSVWLVIALLGGFLFFCSLLANEKRPIIDFGLVTLLSFIFIDGLRPRLWILLVSAGIAIPALLLLAGAMEATRSAGRSLPPLERAALTWDLLVQNDFDYGKISERSSDAATSFRYSYRQNMSYYYPATANVDRYSLIFPLDQVVRHDPQRISVEAVASSFTRWLPRGLVKKTNVSLGDEVAWRYHVRANGSIARPVMGVPATSFAFAGLFGVALLPGLGYFFIFSAAQVLGGRLRNSPLAIGLSAVLLILVEWDFASLFAYLMRPIWVILICLVALRALAVRTSIYRRWRATMVARSR